jgi:hypothetical protein
VFSPVVPLLSKTISGSKIVVQTLCVLKKEIGKNGIFSIELMVSGTMLSELIYFL